MLLLLLFAHFSDRTPYKIWREDVDNRIPLFAAILDLVCMLPGDRKYPGWL